MAKLMKQLQRLGWGSKQLYPHQIKGVKRYLKRSRMFLFNWPMGAGKTSAAVAAALLTCCKVPVPGTVVLVVCPLSLIDQWIEAFQEDGNVSAQKLFSAPTKTQIDQAASHATATLRCLLTTPEFLASHATDIEPVLASYHATLAQVGFIIVDEAHTYRNASTQKRAALKSLLIKIRTHHAVRVLMTTGTANFTDPSNLLSLQQLVELGRPSKSVHASAVHVVTRKDIRHLYRFPVVTNVREAVLTAEHADLECTLTCQFIQVSRKLSTARQKNDFIAIQIYQKRLCAIKAKAITLLSYGDLQTLLYSDALDEEFTLPNDAELLRHCVETVPSLRDLQRHAPKIWHTCDVVTSAPTKLRYVIFAQRRITVCAVVALLRHAGVEAHMFTGSLKGPERKTAIDKWKAAEWSALVMTYECGGVGLNLQEGDVVIHMDPPTTQLLLQAQQRVQRPPRSKPVYVYFVQCVLPKEKVGADEKAGTFDHAMKAMSLARTDADCTMMEHLQAGTDETDTQQLTTLSCFLQQVHSGFAPPPKPSTAVSNPSPPPPPKPIDVDDEEDDLARYQKKRRVGEGSSDDKDVIDLTFED